MKIAQEHLKTTRPPLPRTAICEALKLSRATYYRAVAPLKPAAPPVEKRVPRRIPDPERDRIFALVCQPDDAELPPAQICARMLEAGTVLCSERSMYRILHENTAVRERRPQREHPKRVKPQLTATGPNQVWTWDITKIPGPARGQFFYLYVVLDLYSRYVVAWTLAETQSSAHAQTLFKHGVKTQKLDANRLTVHADNGSAMKSHGLAAVFDELGVARSFSRPRVSNDNAFSEAQFKTVKYHPGLPRPVREPAPGTRILRDILCLVQPRTPPQQPDVVHACDGLQRAARRVAEDAAGESGRLLRQAPRTLRQGSAAGA